MKKNIFLIVALVCSLAFGASQYIQNRRLKEKNDVLTEENKKIEGVKAKDADAGERKVENESKGKDNHRDTEAEEVKLTEGFKIEMFQEYNNFPSIPAYGPLCELNAYGINCTGAVEIIDKENDFLTRVSIQGLIPTWAIENHDAVQYIDNEIMYFVNDDEIYFTPEEESKSVFKAYTGASVTVTGEYDEWYFVTMNYNLDSNVFEYGWVKKSSLGYYDQFESNIGIEVNIKKGGFIRYEGQDELEQINNSSTWGRIMEETELEFVLAMSGASIARVEKKYIETPLTKKSSGK